MRSIDGFAFTLIKFELSDTFDPINLFAILSWKTSQNLGTAFTKEYYAACMNRFCLTKS